MVASAAIGALGSLAAGVVSGGFGLASSTRQYHFQRDLMNLQAELNYKYGKKSALNQYSWQRKGLEKAGYNPLLALGGAEGVANTGWTSSQSAPEGGLGDVVNSALAYAENYRQFKLANSQIDLNSANAETAKANQGLLAQQIVGKALENSYFSRQKESEIALNNAEQFLKLSQMQNELKKYDWFDRKTEAEIYQMLGTTKASLMQGQASLSSAKTQALDSWRRYDLGTNIVTETDGKSNGVNIFGVGGNTGETKSRTYYKKHYKGNSAKQQIWHDYGYDILY